jgi:hypothetical protein
MGTGVLRRLARGTLRSPQLYAGSPRGGGAKGRSIASRVALRSIETLQALLVVVLPLVGTCRLEGQDFGTPPRQAVRVEWTANPAKGRWQAVCGYIHNDGPLASRDVRLAIEGLDAADQVVSTSSAHVLGYISPFGRTYFCSTVPAGAARYSVKILSVEWGGDR